MDTLGERLLFLRNSRKMKASEVMEAIQIDNLGRYEKNQRKPSLDILLSIANFYNVTTDWLLTGEGEMYKPKENQDKEATIPVVAIGRGGKMITLDISPEKYEKVKKLLEAAFDESIYDM